MALPRKGARKLTVEGRDFRWVVSGADEPELGFVVEGAEAPGARLHTFVGHGRIVTPRIVAACIARALASGWTPDLHGPDFRLECPTELLPLELSPYLEQRARWPQRGRAIMAQFDARSVVVDQAYRPSIGRFAAEHGYFGGDFSLSRMTWIKPNFMWMMYRSDWGRSEGQEVVLAVRLHRSAFDEILRAAVHSSFQPTLYPDAEAWKRALKGSQVRLQWDPDHGPRGDKLERRAIQLGLRGEFAARYAKEWIIAIEDISDFVAEQRAHVEAGDLDRLETPAEQVYPAPDDEVATRLRLEPGS